MGQGCFLDRGFRRRREAVGEGEIELERLASVEFEIRPELFCRSAAGTSRVAITHLFEHGGS